MEDRITLYLNRYAETDQGTEGVFSVPDLSFACFCLELPWRDNRPTVSCIPPGFYPLAWSERNSAYQVQNVSGRSGILIHAGNFAGAKDIGYKSDVEGCILLGMHMGYIGKQRCLTSSKIAIKKFQGLISGRAADIVVAGVPRVVNG